MMRFFILFALSLGIYSCAGTPPTPPEYVKFDEDMILSGPIYKKDYQYLLFSVSNRRHKKLSGTLTFQPGSVHAVHSNGEWSLLSVDRVCIKPRQHDRLIEIVPIEQARSTLISTVIIDNSELEMVRARLKSLGFQLTCVST